MIRFPRHGLDSAAVLPLKRGHRHRSAFRRMRAREMCNWTDCDVVFSENAPPGEAVIGVQQWSRIAILVLPPYAILF
jgi:hypothetical protein